MALEVLYATPADDSPVVYCSRHGELQRAVALLGQLADTGEVSPQEFSMAVHNAIAGLHSIATGTHANIVALSGGAATAVAGLVEACGLLADGAARVRLVLCDEPLPLVYADFDDRGSCAYAMLLELSAGDEYLLRALPGAAPPPVRLPAALALLRLLLGRQDAGVLGAGDAAWAFERRA